MHRISTLLAPKGSSSENLHKKALAPAVSEVGGRTSILRHGFGLNHTSNICLVSYRWHDIMEAFLDAYPHYQNDKENIDPNVINMLSNLDDEFEKQLKKTSKITSSCRRRFTRKGLSQRNARVQLEFATPPSRDRQQRLGNEFDSGSRTKDQRFPLNKIDSATRFATLNHAFSSAKKDGPKPSSSEIGASCGVGKEDFSRVGTEVQVLSSILYDRTSSVEECSDVLGYIRDQMKNLSNKPQQLARELEPLISNLGDQFSITRSTKEYKAEVLQLMEDLIDCLKENCRPFLKNWNEALNEGQCHENWFSRRSFASKVQQNFVPNEYEALGSVQNDRKSLGSLKERVSPTDNIVSGMKDPEIRQTSSGEPHKCLRYRGTPQPTSSASSETSNTSSSSFKIGKLSILILISLLLVALSLLKI
eukprot:jgi/Bigna1/86334/estExt_fgenesh1_pg.C_90323